VKFSIEDLYVMPLSICETCEYRAVKAYFAVEHKINFVCIFYTFFWLGKNSVQKISDISEQMRDLWKLAQWKPSLRRGVNEFLFMPSTLFVLFGWNSV